MQHGECVTKENILVKLKYKLTSKAWTVTALDRLGQ